MTLLYQCCAMVGLALIYANLPFKVPFRPFNCSFCMSIWFAVFWFGKQSWAANEIGCLTIGVGLTALLAAIAISTMPWFFTSPEQSSSTLMPPDHPRFPEESA